MLITVRRGRPPAIGRCRQPGCRRDIEWVQTSTGKRIPVNAPMRIADVCADGTVRIEADESHYQTCADARRW